VLRAVTTLVTTQLRASAGTLSVLGLSAARPETPPTTAYLMVGEKCLFDCQFCAQARSATVASAGLLSRVTWPARDAADVTAAVARAYRDGKIGRACFQVVAGLDAGARARSAVEALRAVSQDLPICVSATARTVEEVGEILSWGASRVTIALDAASPGLYARVKGGGNWEARWGLLTAAARAYPGRVGTHLIAGLGESEREIIATIQACRDAGIAVALFAFTPVKGTRLERRPPPDLACYRRVQAAASLIGRGVARAAQMEFAPEGGQLVSYGLPPGEVRPLLAGGEAFRTSGCERCNRPYYNERPGGTMYNYPRPLTGAEAADAVELALAGTVELAPAAAVEPARDAEHGP
jgi:biotin synthase-related radical SAM superfamily protein